MPLGDAEVERLDIKFTVESDESEKKIKSYQERIAHLTASLKNLSQQYNNTVLPIKKAAQNRSDIPLLSRKIVSYAPPIEGNKETGNNAQKSITALHGITEKLHESVGKATTRLGHFFSAMKRIALYRAIRTFLKAIVQGFSEGMNACYQYSKAIDGQFAKSLDRIATSSNYLKNSLGAMIAPVVNMIAPSIDWLVDKIVDLLNHINEVAAKISGASTWTKAIKTPVAYAEAVNTATEANKKFKASILSFDELHVMEDNSDNSGKSGANDNGNYQFVEMPVTEAETNGIIKAISNVANAFDRLWNSQGFQNIRAGISKFIGGACGDVVSGIGDITNAVTDVINLDLDGLCTDVGKLAGRFWSLAGDGAVGISTMIFGEDSDITKSVENKVNNWKAALDEYGLSGAIASWMKDTGIEVINNSDMSDTAKQVGTLWWTNMYNGFVSELQINGLGSAFDKYGIEVMKMSWDGFLIWLKDNSIVGFIEQKIAEIKGKVQPVTNWFKNNIGTPLSDTFSKVKDSITGNVTKVKSWFTKSFSQIKETGEGVFNNLSVISTGVKNTVATAWGKLSGVFSNVWGGFKDKAAAAWDGVKSIFSKVGTFFKNTFSKAWTGIKNVFSPVGDVIISIKDTVVNAFKKLLNGLIDGFNKVITVPFNRINDGLMVLKNFSILGNKPFAGLKEIHVPQIPHMKTGGVLEAGQLFVANEVSPELIGNVGNKSVVANNTQIMEMVTKGVTSGVATANAQQNNILRSIYTILQTIADKGQTITISTSDIINGLDRDNRRRGKIVVPVGI